MDGLFVNHRNTTYYLEQRKKRLFASPCRRSERLFEPECFLLVSLAKGNTIYLIRNGGQRNGRQRERLPCIYLRMNKRLSFPGSRRSPKRLSTVCQRTPGPLDAWLWLGSLYIGVIPLTKPRIVTIDFKGLFALYELLFNPVGRDTVAKVDGSLIDCFLDSTDKIH